MSSFNVTIDTSDQPIAGPTTTKRHPSTGISVLIVGAGPVGAYTALECWRKGHDVRIVERNATGSTQGDYVGFAPQIIKHLQTFWPDLRDENERIAIYPWISYHKFSGERMAGPEPFNLFAKREQDEGMGQQQPIPSYLARMYRHSRPKFLAMLLAHLKRLGIEVEYGRRAVEYYEDNDRGGVAFADGDRLEADVVVAADGMGTKSHRLISGHDIRARGSGWAVARTVYPVKALADDPELEERFKVLDNGHPCFEMWHSRNYLFGVLRTNDQMNWLLMHKDEGTAVENWHKSVGSDVVLDLLSGAPEFPNYGKRLIKSAPEGSIVDWPLMWRDPQPNVASPLGRVVQAGDAAHMFLPSSGSGINQGIEDSIYLASCLQLAGKANVGWATKVLSKLRFERVSCCQKLGLLNHEHRVNVKKSEKDPNKIKMEYGRWIWAHDPEQYVYDKFAAALDHLQTGAPFQNTNIPPGYVHAPWSVDQLMAEIDEGKSLDFDGDWS